MLWQAASGWFEEVNGFTLRLAYGRFFFRLHTFLILLLRTFPFRSLRISPPVWVKIMAMVALRGVAPAGLKFLAPWQGRWSLVVPGGYNNRF